MPNYDVSLVDFIGDDVILNVTSKGGKTIVKEGEVVERIAKHTPLSLELFHKYYGSEEYLKKLINHKAPMGTSEEKKASMLKGFIEKNTGVRLDSNRLIVDTKDGRYYIQSYKSHGLQDTNTGITITHKGTTYNMR